MLNLVLISDEEKIFDGKVGRIDANTINGPVVILPEHQPYLTKITDSISYEKATGATENHKISRGFMYTNGHNCFAIVDTSL